MSELREGILSLQVAHRAMPGGLLKLPVLQPAIRSTTLNNLDLCARKFFWAHRYGLTGKRYVPALEMGDLYHLMMEALYKGQSEVEAGAVADKAIEAAIVRMQSYATPEGLLPDGKMLTDVERTMREDLLKAEAMAFAVWRTFPLDAEKWEVVAVEQMIRLRVLRPPIKTPIRGRLDLLLRHRKSGELWIVDHKTTSWSPALRAATLTFDTQARLYRLQAMSIFPDQKVVGIMHNIVQKPTIKYCSKDENFEAYIQRVSQAYQDKMAKNPKDPPILQSMVRFSEEPLSYELHQKLEAADRAHSMPDPDPQDFPCNNGACHSMGSVCAFLPLCSSDRAMWPDLIDRLYKQTNRDEEELLDPANHAD